MKNNNRSDSKATREFWAKTREEDRAADRAGNGNVNPAYPKWTACGNCGSYAHTFCNR
jgi:hypothetical protein